MQFKTDPYNHQHDAFFATRDASEKAIFWEMGLGKSWLVINTAAWLYEKGEIDTLLVLAPNGVHRNWIDQEIPKHLPITQPYRAVVWQSGKMASRANQDALNALIKHKGFAVFAVNVEAVTRAQNCRNYIERLIRNRKVMAVLDESIVAKSPGTQTTKALVALGRRIQYKRICSGVPITQGPLDLYGQFQFLKEGALGRSYYTFKHTFADWEKRTNHNTNVDFEQLIGYKNQDKLLELCKPYTLRAKKEECLDLPPKIYERRPFALATEQRKIYDKLRDEYIAELSQQEHVPVTHALTRLLRLQQVCSGYWPETQTAAQCSYCEGNGCDRCGDIGYLVETTPLRSLGVNSRLVALQAALAEIANDRQIIIWCRFCRDVDEIHEVIGDDIGVRYYGLAGAEERAASLRRFRQGDARIFAGTARSGGRGLTLTEASVVIYYSHDYSYETRAQSEDRAHRIGQQRSVTYIDLIAENTVDERLMEVVAQKRDLAALFDHPKKWL